MKKFLILILILLVVGVGAIAAYPVYTEYVEREIADWILVENTRNPETTISYDSVEVSPLESKAVFYGLTIDQKTETTSMARTEVETDSFFFLTPVKSLKKLQAIDTTSLSKDNEQTTTIGVITMTNIMGDFTDPSIVTVNTAEFYRRFSVESLLLESMKVDDPLEDEPFVVTQMHLSDIQNGVVDELSMTGISIPTDEADVNIGQFILNGLNMADFLELANGLTVDGPQKTNVSAVLQALNLQRVELQDVSMTPPGERPITIDSFIVSDIVYADGIPIALKTTYDGFASPFRDDLKQSFDREVRPLISAEMPDQVISKGSFQYALDTQQDRLTVSSSTYDTMFETEIQMDFDFRKVMKTFTALTEGQTPDENATMRISLGGLTVRAENKTAWDEPKTVDGKPTARLFLLNIMRSLNLPIELHTAIRKPVQDFLIHGGVLELNAKPEQPIAVLEFFLMRSQSAEYILNKIGFSAEHSTP